MVAPKAAAVVTVVIMAEETKVIEAVVPSFVTRIIVMTDGAVILTPTADVMTRRHRNASTKTTCMAPTCGARTSTNRPFDSPTRSPLGLAVAKIVEEVDAALVVTKAVDEAVEDSKVVAAFRAVAVDTATIMTTTVAVVKVTTTEIRARIMETPHRDHITKAIRTVAASTHTRLLHSLDNKVARPARAFTTLLCPVRS